MLKKIPIVFSMICLLIAGAAHSKEQFSLDLADKNIDASLISDVYRFIGYAEAYLPSKLKIGINRKVTIEFNRLDDLTEIKLPHCLIENPSPHEEISKEHGERRASQIFGRVKSRNTVELNQNFLKEIQLGPYHARAYGCGHRNLYRLAIASLLHELAHLYDESERDRAGSQVSDSHFYVKLAGWSKHSNIQSAFIPVRRADNELHLRSPDPYEYRSLGEHFAVNMEFFLLDPEYSCRRPALAKFLSDHFLWYPQSKCEVNTKVSLFSEDTLRTGPEESDLNPDRIFEVHLLTAMPGETLASHWGHSMFRLVRCAPERAIVGPDCRLDTHHHIVVSFGAFIDDPMTNLWKGVTGGYSMRVFLYNLEEVVNNYTKLQLRDLTSLPIQMDVEEKTRFIYKVLEHYWEVQQKYYFFTNNCCTDAYHLLKGSVQQECMKGFSALTPGQLFLELSHLHMTDPSILEDRNTAGKLGFFFPSHQQSFEKAFQVIRDAANLIGIPFIWENLESYLRSSTVPERYELFSKVVQGGEPQIIRQRKILASFYYLESYIYAKRNQDLKKAIAQRIDLVKGTDLGKNLLRSLVGAVERTSRLRGYGIPLESEIQQLGEVPPQSAEKLDEWIRASFEAELSSIEQVQQNMKEIMHRIAQIRSG